MKITLLHLFVGSFLITILFMYLDSSFFETKKNVFTYFKNSIYCASLTSLTFKIFCTQQNSFNKFNDYSSSPNNHQSQSYNHNHNHMNRNINEPILHGTYPFN